MSFYRYRIIFVWGSLLIGLSAGLNAQSAPELTPPRWSLAPIIGFAPETKWQFGVNTTLLYQGSKQDTAARRSNANAFAIVTTNGQFFFHADHQTLLRNERWILPGKLDYYKFPQLYYGIGGDTPEEHEEVVDLSFLQLSQLFYLRLRPGMFLGPSLRYFRTFSINFMGENPLGQFPPPGAEGSNGLGLGASFLLDTRDHILTSRKGMYLQLAYDSYSRQVGGSHSFNRWSVDWRWFVPLDKAKNQTLAFQLAGMSRTGDVPFNELALLGGERLMRGYYQGRYRDHHLIAGQVEYRFGLLPWLGGTTFVGLGNVGPQWLQFDAPWRSAFGVGLRFGIIPGEDVNLRMDIAFAQGQRNFYFGFAEAF